MGWIGSAVYQVAPKRPQDFDFFSIAMGADYSFELNSIDTYAPNFLDICNNLFLASVVCFHAVKGIRLEPTYTV